MSSLATALRRDTHAAAALLAAARQALNGGNARAAVAHLTLAMRADPLDAALRSARAQSYARLGQWAHAEADCFNAMTALCFAAEAAQDQLAEVYGTLGTSAIRNAHFAVAAMAADMLERAGLRNRGAQLRADSTRIRSELIARYERGLAGLPPGSDDELARRRLLDDAFAPVLGSHPGVLVADTSARAAAAGPRSASVVLPALSQSFAHASAAEVVCVKGKGFGVRATRALQSGDVVLRERPLVAASATPAKQCEHCLRPLPATVAKCSCCACAFCSEACLETAVAAYHGPLCGMSWAHASSAPQRRESKTALAMKLLGMALITQQQNGHTGMQCAPADLPPVELLWRRSDAGAFTQSLVALDWFHDAYRAFRSAALAAGNGNHAGFRVLLDPAFDLDAFAALHDVLAVNAMRVVTASQDGDAGAVLLVAGSIFNHACEANTDWRFDDDAVVEFRTIKPVRAGEELSIAYVPAALPYAQRAQRLFANFGFLCDCAACRSEPAFESTAAAITRAAPSVKHSVRLW